ncbi:uncharacterized protein LOC111319632, partial [Stylophora pistillata]|uniref:uncharacterized protein LOC111319632 n=1 Tax=Stylophora pistillata TaxID=50429 RepID=UPI000C054E26
AEPSIFQWSSQPKQAQGRRVLTREMLAEVKENLIVKPQEDECMKKSMEAVNIPENCVNFARSSDDTEAVLQCENDRSDSSGDSNLKQVTEKSMQTDNVYISPQLTYIECEHDYAFSFTDTPKNPSEYQQSMEERLEVMTEMLNNLKVKVGILQKELDEYKEREFDLVRYFVVTFGVRNQRYQWLFLF